MRDREGVFEAPCVGGPLVDLRYEYRGPTRLPPDLVIPHSGKYVFHHSTGVRRYGSDPFHGDTWVWHAFVDREKTR